MSTPASRILRTLLFAASVVAVAVLTLAPQGLVGPLRADFVLWADDVRLPLVAGVGYPVTERLFNAVLFAPLGGALAALLPRRAWLVAPIACALVSTAVEYAQAGIPGRIPDLDDIVWNTAGGTAAAVLVGLARLVAVGARQRGSRART
ncbi:VanZ family protein [Microbacterium sp. 10M-3C3]|jgi:hypothetical protein|uniref:VanZ family protein n=1 Tax=Microbacterium sp. 10M-3C3 TaxID=2483401 RepID=UPI000F62F220|nr:VanZ family protein [Microbacterium sp. 10M-3C3]